MTQTRPDLLPLAFPARIGLPYHGKVKASRITLPDSSTRTYAQPTGADAFLVKHPRAAVPVYREGELAAETAKGYNWKDYAILTGDRKELGGNELGANKWLYCDANNTWVMSFAAERGEDDYVRTISIYVEKLFGRLTDDADKYTMSPRKIYEHVLADDDEVSNYLAFEDDWPAFKYSMTEDGSEVVINILNTFAINDPTRYDLYMLVDDGLGSAIVETFKVTVSGNGGTTIGSVGIGISATSTRIWKKQPDEVVVEQGSQRPSTGVQQCELYPHEPCTADPNYSLPTTSGGGIGVGVGFAYLITERTTLAFIDSAGEIKHVKVRTEYRSDSVVEETKSCSAYVLYSEDLCSYLTNDDPPVAIYGTSDVSGVSEHWTTVDTTDYELKVSSWVGAKKLTEATMVYRIVNDTAGFWEDRWDEVNRRVERYSETTSYVQTITGDTWWRVVPPRPNVFLLGHQRLSQLTEKNGEVVEYTVASLETGDTHVSSAQTASQNPVSGEWVEGGAWV